MPRAKPATNHMSQQRLGNVPDINALAEMLDEAMEPVLTHDEVIPIEQALDLSPEEFQKATGRAYQIALIEGLRHMPRAKSIKEIASLHKLFREAHGIDKPKDQGIVPNGLVPNMRVVNRRMIEVVEVTDEPPAPATTTAIDPMDFEV